ncbi:MAG TPA: GMC family oxidoreductase [Longimicrobiales bacterium]|nr:GMC family oxidoreductase [Longimicrobiales bacterium]
MIGQIIHGADFAAEHGTETFDFVIIGSGAAGATAARVLVDTGATVAIVEEGSQVTSSDFTDTVWPALRDLYRGTGAQVTRGRGAMGVVQGRCLGGSTVVNSAIAWRMPETVWQSWETEYGLAEALPYAEIVQRWAQIDRELSVQPTAPEVWGGNNVLLEKAAKVLGVLAGPTSRYTAGCLGSARCQLGCPNRAKRSMAETYLPYAVESGATIITNARAERVLSDRSRASGVLIRASERRESGRRGRTLTIHARKGVVVAASAVQTPGILARSGLRSPHLGKHFQAHPGALVAGVFDREVSIWNGATQGYNVYQYLDDARCKIETLSLPPEILFARLPGVGSRWLEEIAHSNYLATLAIVLRAHAEGAVRERRWFGGTDIRYDLESRDISNLRKGLRFACELLFAAGAREVLTGVHGLPERLTSPDQLRSIEAGPDDAACYSLTTSHLFGTARMSPDPAGGVVDADFAAHRLPGLYVVDSSVFPTNLGVNPQHTIMAIAMYGAERIAEMNS